MINFGVYTSKYCIVFFARKKDLAAKMFEIFLFFSSAHLNARSTISERTVVVYIETWICFARRLGVVRKLSEAGNSASNGKAERVHKTVLNMARCMMFASGLPLHFWGDAV